MSVPYPPPHPPYPPRKPLTDTERTAILDNVVAQEALNGGRIGSRAQHQVVVVYGPGVNHVLHAILSLFTCGLWLLVWLVVAVAAKGEQRVVSVDLYGNVRMARAAHRRR